MNEKGKNASIEPKHISQTFRAFLLSIYFSKIISEIHAFKIQLQSKQCQILWEYAQYVAKVREYARRTELDEAVEQAVNDCIQNGILAEFLRKNKSEVIAMSIFEYNKEEEERKLRKAEYEAGREEGIKEGIKEGELQKTKETAIVMNKMKFPVEKIAEVLRVDEAVIVEWIKKNKEN